MKSILVTGGAGYIGSHTVVELVAAGYRPVIIDDFSNSYPSVVANIESIIGSKISTYKGDFKDKKLVAHIISEENIVGVVHFAAFKDVNESASKPLAYYDNNVSGMVSLLKTLESAQVNNLIFSSSCIVYGEADKLPVTEKSPIKPALTPYGASKQMCEEILHDTAKANPSLNAISLRYFNPVGAHPSAKIGELPRGKPTNLIPLITQTAAGLRDALTVYGDNYKTLDGSCVRDFIHVVDLAKAHVKALDLCLAKNGGFYDMFNVGTGKGTTVLQAIRVFEQATGKKVNYRIGPRRKGDIIVSYAGVKKAKTNLGWRATKTLSQALADAWRWQQKLAKMGEIK